MNLLKSYSRRSLAWLLGFNIILGAAAISLFYYTLCPGRSALTAQDSPAVFFACVGGLFIGASLVQWTVLRLSLKRLLSAEKESGGKPADKTSPDKAGQTPSKKELQDLHRRYYLHLLSVLQRKGRLLDFLEEDLSGYSDAQIGAAVRGVHENCSSVLEKYLAPRGIIEKPEGGEVTIGPDFDPSAVKLTGNVTGDPPFTGLLRHQGWKAGKIELPVLTAGGDPSIIAPAEVEVS